MTEHKHAWFLREVADGVPSSKFEANYRGHGWKNLNESPVMNGIATSPDDYEIRRKPRTIRIGSRDVPAPLDEMPEEGERYYFLRDLDRAPFTLSWNNSELERGWFESRLLYKTKEDAEAVRLALLEVLEGDEE